MVPALRLLPTSVVAGVALIAAGAASPVARAQAPAAAQAEALFRQGKALLATKNYREACPKLAASQRLDAATGTLLALALCHEGEGKVASAWGEFVSVANEARTKGQTDREALAKAHAAALEGKLPTVRIQVSPLVLRLGGLSVKMDDAVVDPGALGSALPADPGDHVVTVVATGFEPRTEQFQLAPATKERSVFIESLEPVVASAAAPLAPHPGPPPLEDAPARSAPRSPRKPIALAIAGVGVATTAVGAVFGIKTLGEASDVHAACPAARCTDAAAVKKNQDASTHATIADVAIGGGIVLAAVAAAIWLTAPDASKDAPRSAILPKGWDAVVSPARSGASATIAGPF